MSSLLIRDAMLVTATDLLKVDVLVQDGIISKLAFHDSPGYALPAVPDDPTHEVIEAEGLLLLPSLIDCHVHLREPGLTHKGTMKTEAAAARAGGVGTVCDMPNTDPPTVTAAALADKIRRASEIDACDIRFFFGVTDMAHTITLERLWLGQSEEMQRLKARCCGVKVYLDHSTGNQKVGEQVLEDLFRVAGAQHIPVVAHSEDPVINAEAAAKHPGTDVSVHSLRRPPESEVSAVGHAIDLARKYGAQLHVAHLSTKGGLELVRSAKKDGLQITCEVAPHHLFLTTEDYEWLGTKGKMNPPLRDREHAEALWAGITDGTVDCIATDHAPHTLEEKNAPDPLTAPSGVPGVETMVPLLLSVASGMWPHPGSGMVRPGSPQVGNGSARPSTGRESGIGMEYQDIVRLCFENPNKIFSLGKPGIKEGAKADLVLIDPKKEWTIHGEDLHSLCKWTPYEGWRVRGAVVRSISPRKLAK